ncbi:MAG: hypothetical protein JKY99_01260 [Rhizobiales bacterium]|nr:hypothetical protein [Hyphomicrobiales bacterium]
MAYDANRNALRDDNGKILLARREPLPEVLRGNVERMRQLIDSCAHQWTYRAGVLSFAIEDAPTPRQQQCVMDEFEQLAFAGLALDQRDILWVRHTHEARVELHFLTPRMVLSSGLSLNIAPPGYQKSYDALRDSLNKKFGWCDPQAPERAREVKSPLESINHGMFREQIHDWVLSRIETGEITNRPEIVDALKALGLQVPRAGKAYITICNSETGKRWRLKGEIFDENWTRANTVERAFETERHQPSQSGSRLDAIDQQTLRDSLHKIIETRARYNRKRYGDDVPLDPSPPSDVAQSNRSEQQPDGESNQAGGLGVDDWNDCFYRHEPIPDLAGFDRAGEDSTAKRISRSGDGSLSKQRANTVFLGSGKTHFDDVHDQSNIKALPEQGHWAIASGYDETTGNQPTHPLGKRIAALRRKVDTYLRGAKSTSEGLYARRNKNLERKDHAVGTWVGSFIENTIRTRRILAIIVKIICRESRKELEDPSPDISLP